MSFRRLRLPKPQNAKAPKPVSNVGQTVSHERVETLTARVPVKHRFENGTAAGRHHVCLHGFERMRRVPIGVDPIEYMAPTT